jgi:hypothetical protein
VVDLTRPENLASWQALGALEPGRSRIELFDMVWWMYFRELEPLQRTAMRVDVPAAAADETAPDVGPVDRVDPASAEAEDDVIRFQDDDDGYLRWLGMHPGGLVLNCGRQPRADYLKLHRAACTFISGVPTNGQIWTGSYIKMCATDPQTLTAWARRATGATPSPCLVCRP